MELECSGTPGAHHARGGRVDWRAGVADAHAEVLAAIRRARTILLRPRAKVRTHFLRRALWRIVRVVVVHLIDGTFELFRYFLSPGAAFDRSAPPELRAVRGVVASILGMLEGGATHLGVARIMSSNRFATRSGRATRRARGWTRCCTPSSSRWRMR